MSTDPSVSARRLGFIQWTLADTRGIVRAPQPGDDKYSRGVLGVITGSTLYPGAAVLGVEAALRTGLGMVRYLGPARAADLVLQRRPETVTGAGRVQAWLIGSGMESAATGESSAEVAEALRSGQPVVLDAGALASHADTAAPTVLTPHFGELARITGKDKTEIAADPATSAVEAADSLGRTVLLKGAVTYVASPAGTRLSVTGNPAWLATAGSGDALGGVLGALLAGAADRVANEPDLLAPIAASAAVLHGLAGALASERSGGGPFVILELAEHLPAAVSRALAAS